MLRLISFCFACFELSCALGWPAVHVDDRDASPSIELSLEPAGSPLPALSVAVERADSDRLRLESAMMENLQLAQALVLAGAKKQISRVVSSFADSISDATVQSPIVSGVSFLDRQSHEPRPVSFKVHVAPESEPGDVAMRKVMEFGRTLHQAERRELEKAISDVAMLGDFVVGELDARLRRELTKLSDRRLLGPRSFLDSRGVQVPLDPQASVRVVPASAPFPTAASLVDGLSRRARASFGLVRARADLLLLDMAQSLNRAARDALKVFAFRIEAQLGANQ